MIYYAIKNGEGYYLSDIEANGNYCPSGTAPTMGNRHCYNEYKTIWGKQKTTFEPLTAVSNIKVLLEEFRWGSRKPFDFKIETITKGEK